MYLPLKVTEAVINKAAQRAAHFRSEQSAFTRQNPKRRWQWRQPKTNPFEDRAEFYIMLRQQAVGSTVFLSEKEWTEMRSLYGFEITASSIFTDKLTIDKLQVTL